MSGAWLDRCVPVGEQKTEDKELVAEGFWSRTHKMYSLGVENQFRQRIDAVINDPDARNFILRAGKRVDLSEAIGDVWANSWSQTELQQLAAMTQAARQDSVAARVRAFLDDPAVTSARVRQAVARTRNADLRLQAQVAQVVGADLVRFNSDVFVRFLSPFTGKIRYRLFTDIDVETIKAIIEVTTQADAGDKISQLQVLLNAEANPKGKPVLHFMPKATAGAEAALMANGSWGVYRDLSSLLAILNALP